MSLLTHTFSIEKKYSSLIKEKYSISSELYNSEGGFNELKHIQKFDHSDRVGIEKVEIDLKLEAIVTNIKKLRTHLNVTLI